MAYDDCIRQQASTASVVKGGDCLGVKSTKSGAEVLTLAEDGSPTKPGLKRLQADFLEQPHIVMDRESPLSVVIVQEIWRCQCPFAPGLSVKARGDHAGWKPIAQLGIPRAAHEAGSGGRQ